MAPPAHRAGWIAGVLIVLAIVALLAAIAERDAPASPGQELAPGESETLRARVVDALEERTVDQGDFQQPYQLLRLRFTEGDRAGQEVEVEH